MTGSKVVKSMTTKPSSHRRWSAATAAALSVLGALPAAAQSVTLDPQGSGPLAAALAWIQGTLLGSVATAIAVIAVASVGLLMLTGRMNWRFGATVVIGLFILFGAGAIVGGIRSVAVGG
jgi:type IV secretory pathway VirB2 component (pilin)